MERDTLERFIDLAFEVKRVKELPERFPDKPAFNITGIVIVCLAVGFCFWLNVAYKIIASIVILIAFILTVVSYTSNQRDYQKRKKELEKEISESKNVLSKEYMPQIITIMNENSNDFLITVLYESIISGRLRQKNEAFKYYAENSSNDEIKNEKRLICRYCGCVSGANECRCSSCGASL